MPISISTLNSASIESKTSFTQAESAELWWFEVGQKKEEKNRFPKNLIVLKGLTRDPKPLKVPEKELNWSDSMRFDRKHQKLRN